MVLKSGREVTVTMSNRERDRVQFEVCQAFKTALDESQIIDSVRALNLRALDEIVLRRLVSVYKQI